MVTSYVLGVIWRTFVTPEVIAPEGAKSIASTPDTFSANVTRNTSESAFVELVAGNCLTIETTPGRILSSKYVSSVAGSAPTREFPAASRMFWGARFFSTPANLYDYFGVRAAAGSGTQSLSSWLSGTWH